MYELIEYYRPFGIIEKLFEAVADSRLIFYANDILNEFGCENEEDRHESLRRAMNACATLSLPVEQNFKKVYRGKGESVEEDWKISRLGYILVVINGDPSNPMIASAQISIIKRALMEH